MNVFVFDIETIPDLEGGRRLYGLADLGDEEVGRIMFHKRREESGGSEFLRHHLHRVVAISVLLRNNDALKIWSLGTPDAPEEELVRRFFDGIDKFTPTLVSWNGGGFDLPVLHYRSLVHGVPAPRYWETGEEDREFRFNNYLNRYHERHTDLMDMLSGYQLRANASLQDIATLLGFPGKMGMEGARVWEHYLAGKIEAIRNYCETDVLNTYLVYLRFELVRGRISPAGYAQECERLRAHLSQEDQSHFSEFLAAWKENRKATSAAADARP